MTVYKEFVGDREMNRLFRFPGNLETHLNSEDFPSPIGRSSIGLLYPKDEVIAYFKRVREKHRQPMEPVQWDPFGLGLE